MIPWKSRYSATVIFTVIMLADGVMTLQSLDYWYQRVNGTEPDIPVAQFYGKYFDNDYMENRFQSMTMSPRMRRACSATQCRDYPTHRKARWQTVNCLHFLDMRNGRLSLCALI